MSGPSKDHFRKRMLSFPSSARRLKYLTPAPPDDTWGTMEWRGSPASSARSSPNTDRAPESLNVCMAEKEFLASPVSGDFEQLRSFSVSKKGNMVDHGFCYKPTNDESATMLF